MKKLCRKMLAICVSLMVCLSMTACFKAEEEPEVQDIFKEAEERSKQEEIRRSAKKTEEPAAEAPKITLGELDVNKYSNDYFGFEFTFPNDWDDIYSLEDRMDILKSLNDVDSPDEIVLEEQDALPLFIAVKSTILPRRQDTSIIFVSANKIEASDNFDTVEKFLEESLIDVAETFSDIKRIKLGSKEFKYVQSLDEPDDDGYDEKIYVGEINDYSIIIFTLDYNKEATSDINKFIKSIKFK